jgi:DNA polymerase elongation subunit (family B)
LAKKTYKLLAENIYDYFDNLISASASASASASTASTAAIDFKTELEEILLHAFEVKVNPIKYSDILPVYPKEEVIAAHYSTSRSTAHVNATMIHEWVQTMLSISSIKKQQLALSGNTIDSHFMRFNNRDAEFAALSSAARDPDTKGNKVIDSDGMDMDMDYNDDDDTGNDDDIGNDDDDDADAQFEIIENAAVDLTMCEDETPLILELLGEIGGTLKPRIKLINEIDRQLFRILPPLEGDKVTFIGSSFMHYGDKDPYKYHCIVLKDCAPVREYGDNCIIETYNTEREVLLAWTALIQRENPDIVYGYNIDGFDYKFMFHRADETKCLAEFLKLSRNREEICTCTTNQSPRTKSGGGAGDQGPLAPINTSQYHLTEVNVKLASGEFIMENINMIGRFQFDPHFYYRREFQLDSYKLDDVAGEFIRDSIKSLEPIDDDQSASASAKGQGPRTRIKTKNMLGLTLGAYIHIEEMGNSVDYYNAGEKFKIIQIDYEKGWFIIAGNPTPDTTKGLKWCLAKDNVSVNDIFMLANGTAEDRAIVAKYCIQDCNLVHYLVNKNDIITDYVEMAAICWVPMNYLVTRGQSIKLYSLLVKNCRERGVLIKVVDKLNDGSYEGAIVLKPKCDLYLDKPIAVNDFSSLYPSSMISENISHDSKVWTQEFDLDGNLIKETGVKDENGEFIYDNLEGYDYVNITYDTYKTERNPLKPKAKPIKVKCGSKICRFAQFPDGEKGIIPLVLEILLQARKSTRALIKTTSDPSLKRTYDMRQLNYKKCANSIYGQCGASTSPFCEKDIAASTTAVGRMNITYAKRIVEEVYGNAVLQPKCYPAPVKTRAEYIYGDTDSIFYTFNLQTMDGTPIVGKPALEITIELAKLVGQLASAFLKAPHDWVYEKTFMPLFLFAKKRYIGMLYEDDPDDGHRKEMGVLLKRRDNAPIAKDVYGGVIDILLNQQDIHAAMSFVKTQLNAIVSGKTPLNKLLITKQLRSGYANPKQIAHKVLADRIADRDPGNGPKPGDRIGFVHINNTNPDALQGDKIEIPDYVVANQIPIDYVYYITNQIMKPLQQVFALILERIWESQGKRPKISNHRRELLSAANAVKSRVPANLQGEYKTAWVEKKTEERWEKIKHEEVYKLLFESCLRDVNNKKMGNRDITTFFTRTH